MDLVDDLLHSVYDHIYILDLVKLRLVSKRWDALALDHPNYWRNLFLRATTPGAIQFFFSRLSRSHRRPIDVHVVFPDDENVAVAQDPEHYRAVYTVVATHMDHITSLNLCGPVHHCSDIFGVVRHAAPLLNDLTVNLQLPCRGADAQRQDITLPGDLLHDFAPFLRIIFLHNVILDAYSPPCVACVTKASVVYTGGFEVTIPHLPTWFSKATALAMGGSLSIESASPQSTRSWQAIEDFTFHNNVAWWHVYSLAGCGHRVRYFDWGFDMLDSVHQRLTGSLSYSRRRERVLSDCGIREHHLWRKEVVR
ncbi:hypothetical protein EXIGLDRAFT_762015 [Exidia glandulosa HHB12029]|uniref:F-box domain-containing protein n=1 Tax=Exidia glandulosa HHB12029 TaxID=1314781 RepID=A0A165N3E8_EXIGL|nr:hypothetical protein EXIGLDRAFT_762015 [Exidia glandulosa HHB12029]